MKEKRECSFITEETNRKLNNEIREHVLKFGIWNFPKLSFSKQYSIPVGTIMNRTYNIIKMMNYGDVRFIVEGLKESYQSAMNESEKILKNEESKPYLKLEAAKTIAMLEKNYTEMIENYGLKSKLPFEIKGEVKHNVEIKKVDIIRILDERKKKEKLEEIEVTSVAQ